MVYTDDQTDKVGHKLPWYLLHMMVIVEKSLHCSKTPQIWNFGNANSFKGSWKLKKMIFLVIVTINNSSEWRQTWKQVSNIERQMQDNGEMLSKVLCEQNGRGRSLYRGANWNSIFSTHMKNNSYLAAPGQLSPISVDNLTRHTLN